MELDDYGFTRQQLNGLIEHEVMPAVAEELDLDILPMGHKSFDFFNRGVNLLRSATSLQDQKLYHMTSDVIHQLIHHTPRQKKGEGYTEEQKDIRNVKTHRGPLYKYADYLGKKGLTPEQFPFDSYFVMLFKRRLQNERKREFGTGKGRTSPHFSTDTSGQFEEERPGGALVPSTLADPSSPAPSYRAEYNEKRNLLDDIIPDVLAKERNAKVLLLFYQMFFKDNIKVKKIGERLDELGENDDDYKPAKGDRDISGNKIKWSTTTLSRFEDTITDLIMKYVREKARTKHPEALTPEQQRAIFQSRRRA